MHLTRIADVDREWIESLFDESDALQAGNDRPLQGRIVAGLFFEPSTRTRLSFESAALRLGAQVIGIADAKSSSAAKGESLIDSIRIVERYADLIVLRHPAEGAAALAAKVAGVPVINAGDGGHEHPTQTLLDLYTIHRQFGDIGGRTIGFLGDLRFGRTVHSLAKAAAWFGARFICIAPPELQLPGRLVRDLTKHTDVRVAETLDEVIAELDVLYVTRVQVERMDEELRRSSRPPHSPLAPASLARARSDLLVLHPLPRVGEIHYEVDEDSRARYFEQAGTGVTVRMALLTRMLAERPVAPRDLPWRAVDESWGRCVNPKCVTRLEHDIAPRREGDVCAYCRWE
jgi:aspartate carbamoyltransferase catalytic subunit